MTGRYALLTRFVVEPEAVPQVVRALRCTGQVYQAADAELLWVAEADTAEALLHLLPPARLDPLLRSDYCRQILTPVETVRATRPLAESTYLLVRHGEVSRHVLAEYLSWREGTIFAYVRRQPLVESFHAYQTLVGAQPGVVFLSGFSCPPSDYLAFFDTAAYRAISQASTERFLAKGSPKAKIYARL